MSGLIYTTTAILTFACAVTWVTQWLETGRHQTNTALHECLNQRPGGTP